MSAPAAPISIPSIFNTLSSAPRTRDHHAAARILAGIDPKRFLSNLQMAAMHHSPQAISALKADMHELADIFHKLSRSGHDVSAAQRDFKMLELYVSQLASTQKQRSPPQAPIYSYHPTPTATGPKEKSHSQQSSYHSYGGDHHRSSSLPTSTSTLSSSHEQSRSRSGSIATEKTPRHHHHPLPLPNRAPAAKANPGSTASSSSSSSSIVAPTPGRLSKPRRHSAPATIPTKRVHWASHATVYTFAAEAPLPPAPPSRPSCVPRVSSH